MDNKYTSDNKENGELNYFDILQFVVPFYQAKGGCNNPVMQFVPENDINIVGVINYQPYMVSEVKKIRKFIKK